ncbi:hypothetical protein SynPROSU1_00684 [Synechococcus sp. PROS-U-1]|nr:hypothetical protein SynPROSU1_00684 [Synechococcus sp. PROS-U-1]
MNSYGRNPFVLGVFQTRSTDSLLRQLPVSTSSMFQFGSNGLIGGVV